MKREEILNKEIQKNSKLIEDIVYDISRQYTKPLDDIMVICKQIFTSGDKITDEELEDLLTQLPSVLYFVNEGQEFVGLKEDVAKITKTTNYNIVREKATGTVADKNTTAELSVMNEEINRIIYQRSYKMIKSKVEMGQEMINSLKRVYDARKNDYEISRGVKR